MFAITSMSTLTYNEPFVSHVGDFASLRDPDDVQLCIVHCSLDSINLNIWVLSVFGTLFLLNPDLSQRTLLLQKRDGH